MMKILILHGNAKISLFFKKNLHAGIPGCEVWIADTLLAATDILERQTINAIITDLGLDDFEAFRFLLHQQETLPLTPVFLLTRGDIPRQQSLLKTFPGIECFKTPVFIDDFIASMKKTRDFAIQPFEKDKKTETLCLILLLMELETATSRLCIKRRNRAEDYYGLIHMEKGGLVSAEAGLLKNQEALQEIFSWDDFTVELGEGATGAEQEIRMSASELVSRHRCQHHQGFTEECLRELESFFSHTDGVRSLRVYDRDDHVLYAEERSPGITEPEMSLSAFFAHTAESERLLNVGKLQCMVFKPRSQLKHMISEYGDLRFIATLEPGANPVDFLKKMTNRDSARTQWRRYGQHSSGN